MAEPDDSRRAQTFPVLTAAQIARVQRCGSRVALRAGEVLVEPGQRYGGMLVVLSGAIAVQRPGIEGDELIAIHRAGEFAGELSTLRGAAAMVRLVVHEDGEAVALDHEGLRRVVQSDAELSELLMRAFILRRMRLIASQQGDVVLIGSRHSADTLRLQQFLGRNGFPYVNVDVERDAAVQDLLERFDVCAEEIPVVVCRGKVLRNPTNEGIAECLGMNAQMDESAVRDLIVIGAGPAGLAAAVYAASEGLDTLVLETTAPGGQAGASSRIENYLGFPTGISGQALAGRAFVQAQKFGAHVMIAATAAGVSCGRRPYDVVLGNGRVVHARTIIVASGAEYRPLALPNLSQFVGVGVYYAATHVELKLCADEDVVVVGGGNSAGQAAVFLSAGCRHVHLLVRSTGLADSMSRYLIRRIEQTPNITLRTQTEIVELAGNGRLERVTWRSKATDASESHPIGHVFLMTGATPNTRWLDGCVALDDKGFVLTGPDLCQECLTESRWPLARPPHLLETNLPGIFAVGDVRSGSIKRVAAAVGEGAAAVKYVHEALHQ